MNFADAWMWFLVGIGVFGVLAVYTSRRYRQALNDAARHGGPASQYETSRGGFRILWWALTVIFIILFVASISIGSGG